MKRAIGLVVCATLVLSLAAGGAFAESGKLNVCASFYPMFDFARKIGGNRVEVTNMVPSGMEPHDWEPTPQDIVTLEKADVFIYNGAGMEHWVEDVLASLGSKRLTAVEASKGIALMEGHAHEREEGQAPEYSHPDGKDHEHDSGGADPHVWLNPANAKVELANIKNAFIKADPENASYYEANYETWAKELDALDQEFRDALNPYAGREIIVAHQAFGYLCAAYGIKQVAIEGLAPDSEPDPARVAEIIDFAKAHAVKVVFFEEMVSPKVAETIAKAIGAKTDVLSPVEGLSDEQLASGGDYFSAMRQNLKALAAALA